MRERAQRRALECHQVAGLAHARIEALQRAQIIDAERDLLDRSRGPFRPPRANRQLVVLVSTAGQERELAVGDRAPVGNDESQILGVEMDRALDIAHKDAAVAELDLHRISLSVELNAG